MIYNPRVYTGLASFEVKLDEEGFEYLGAGGTRKVYRRGDIVIKIPINSSGIYDNEREASAYKYYKNHETPDGFYLAPCRLLSNGCLMMKRVELIDNYEELPSWADYIDCQQVGRYHARYVAYDYANDVWRYHNTLCNL